MNKPFTNKKKKIEGLFFNYLFLYKIYQFQILRKESIFVCASVLLVCANKNVPVQQTTQICLNDCIVLEQMNRATM